MSNPAHPSTATGPWRSLASRYPRTASVAVLAVLFACSVGLLYATVGAVTVGRTVPGVTLVGSAWLLSVLAVALAVQPRFHRLGTTGAIPPRQRRRIEAVCAGHGVPVRRSWTTGELPGTRPATVAGLLPWDCHFVVDDWFLASLSPAERAALAAREAELARRRYHLYRHLAGPAVVAVVAALLVIGSFAPAGAFVGPNASLLLGAASAGLYALAARHGTNTLHAADRHAARLTSREAVVGLLEKTADRCGQPPWRRWPVSMLVMYPTTERRIERVRALGGSVRTGP